MRQNFVAQFLQLLKRWLWAMQSGVVELGPFCRPMPLQALQFSVHLINLLSILLRCNSFARIQKTVADQTGSRPPNSDHDLFLVQVWLWELLWSCFLVQPLNWLSYKIHFSLHVTIRLRNGLLLLRRIKDYTSKQ
uniref:Uncharacterized protein n=1 Tax=Macaca fascicularis TaxID=9541 RepID=A0A7N9IH72_MACFA